MWMYTPCWRVLIVPRSADQSNHNNSIALRILIGHYLALHQEKRRDYVGLVCLQTRLQDVVGVGGWMASIDRPSLFFPMKGIHSRAHEQPGPPHTHAQVAVNDARWICKKRYGRAPRVEVVGDDLTLAIIPEHLYYVVLELMKNSLRAVSERFYADLMSEPPEPSDLTDMVDREDGLPAFTLPPSKVPPIRVTISRDYSLLDGQQVQIEVADEGGGCVVVVA